jgi:hypothetical protein
VGAVDIVCVSLDSGCDDAVSHKPKIAGDMFSVTLHNHYVIVYSGTCVTRVDIIYNFKHLSSHHIVDL